MLDYMAIASSGVYPTPTPTGTERAIFAVSMGLLAETFAPPVENNMFSKLFGGGIKYLKAESGHVFFNQGDKR